uniref:SpoIID/LytB domain-containing protein n=1 Tax=Oscillatoriales cyanobacterium SpSt-418 TaxID=2282169 RepID=A0A7C3PD12_9CYAN
MKEVGGRQKIMLAVSGFVALAIALLIGERFQESQPIQPATKPTPTQNKVAAIASPAVVSSPKPSPKVSPTPKKLVAQPSPKPTLTQRERELNQQAKAAFNASRPSADSLVEMQVAIAEGAAALTLTTTETALLTDKEGKPLKQLPKESRYSVQPGERSLYLGGQKLPPVVWLDPGLGGTFQLGDRVYKGQLLLVSDAGKLWAVNTINLRQYLYSVVGSEVSPSWDMEALKAQAIAARSYALTYYFKPVSPLFHLGANEYYQVYSGIAKEAERTRQAVDATGGQYISYKGGVVESLYAASDDIVAEAFRGKGMSQLGAKALAAQGYKHQEILQHYYPGTAIARIKQFYE